MRDNSGSLKRNDKKLTEKHPDAKGKCMIAGVEYFIAGWLRTGESERWTSLSFTPCEERQEKHAPPLDREVVDRSDDIPF